MLERNKIQIQSTNNHRKKILSNTTTNNPTTTNRYINNTDSIREKQLILEGKDLERYLIPQKKLLDPIEKKNLIP